MPVPYDPWQGDNVSIGTIAGKQPTALTNDDIVNTLYKKSRGYANTKTIDIAVEYPINSSPFIVGSKVAGQIIPVEGVPDVTILQGESNSDFDVSGFAGGKRYVWKQYDYIVYYSNIVLSSTNENPGQCFHFHSVQHNILTNIIPENIVNYGSNKYSITVEKDVSGTWVTLSPNLYILDRDAGVLTIYEENSVINGTNPPRISFWRYEGKMLNDLDLSSLERGQNNFENLLTEQPPAPTHVSTNTTSASISIQWKNPDQHSLGILPVLIPFIKYLNITVTAGNNTYNIFNRYVIVENDTSRPLITTLKIVYASGINGFDTNGTRYVWYVNDAILSGPVTISIWYTNYSPNLPNVLTVSNISLDEAGAPSTPTLLFIEGDGYDGTFRVTNGEWNDAKNTSNEPSIKSYSISYTPTDVSRRGGLFDTDSITINNITDITKGVDVSGLLPGTTYTASVSITNSLGKSMQSEEITFTIQPPPLGRFVDDIPLLNDTFSSMYNNTPIYFNGSIIESPIVEQGKDWECIMKDVFITRDVSNNISNIKLEVINSERISILGEATIDFSGAILEGSGYGFVTNVDGIEIIDVSGIMDPYSDSSSGFYYKATLSIKIATNALGAGNKYIVRLTQTIGNEGGVNGNQEFYVDDFTKSKYTATELNGYQIGNLSDTKVSCGVPITSGNWGIHIYDISTINSMRYFYPDNILSYKFANETSFTSFFDVKSYSITGPSDTITFYPYSNQTQSGYKDISGIIHTEIIQNPTFTLKVTNSYGISGEMSKQLYITIDNATYNYIKNTVINCSDKTDGKCAGMRMKTSRKLFNPSLSMYSDNVRDDMFSVSAIPEYRKQMNQNESLVEDASNNELQFIAGKYLTAGYTGDGSGVAYSTYGDPLSLSFINYTSLRNTSGYRWATFRWEVTDGKANTMNISIHGIDTSGLEIKDNGVFIKSDSKPIYLYYRIENSNYEYGDPTNKLNTQFQTSDGKSISTVWINANSFNMSQYFGSYMGLHSYSGLLGGIFHKDNILFSTNNVIYNVITPAYNLTDQTIYIYATVGLPMDSDIAFTNLTCETFII